MMRRRILLLAALAAACKTVTAPPPVVTPPRVAFDYTVHVYEGKWVHDNKAANAPVWIPGCDAPRCKVLTDGAGNVTLHELPPGPVTICAGEAGYLDTCRDLMIPTIADDGIFELVSAKPPKVRGRLHADGRRLRFPDGKPFPWIGVTGFPAMAGDAFYQWADDRGFTIVRVLFGDVSWLPQTAAQAVAAMPGTLAKAEQHGLYVEAVALTDTASWTRDQIRAHVKAVGAACAFAVNCVLELANENYHPTQNAGALTDLAFLRELRSLVPASLPVSFGAGTNDEADNYPGGDYITIHRSRDRDAWNMTRHIREQEQISADSKKFVVDDEPIGAAEANDPGRRLADPRIFKATGVLGRVFGLGVTYHFENGLRAQVPPEGSIQNEAARQFVEGARVLPDDIELSFQNSGWPQSPVIAANFETDSSRGTVLRVYSGIGARSLMVGLRVQGDPQIRMRDPWHVLRTLIDDNELQVWEIGR